MPDISRWRQLASGNIKLFNQVEITYQKLRFSSMCESSCRESEQNTLEFSQSTCNTDAMTTITINFNNVVKLTDDQFYQVCRDNPELKFERNQWRPVKLPIHLNIIYLRFIELRFLQSLSVPKHETLLLFYFSPRFYCVLDTVGLLHLREKRGNEDFHLPGHNDLIVVR
jgi:hypothetical protein